MSTPEELEEKLKRLQAELERQQLEDKLLELQGQLAQQQTPTVPAPAPPIAAIPFTPRVIPQISATPEGQEKKPMEVLLGSKLYKQRKLISCSTVAGVCQPELEFCLLFFGACSFQRESKAFLPHLVDFYHASAGAAGCYEVVYISSDRSLVNFKETFAKMPWLAMPAGTSDLKNLLSQQLKVVDQPTVVVMNVATGLVVTTQAAEHIQSLERGNMIEQAKALVEAWKQMAPITFEQVEMDMRLKYGTQLRGTLYWQT